MKIWLLLLVLGVLGGCTAMHPADPYTTLDVKGCLPSEPGPARQGPQVPAGPLTLQRAIKTALANNPKVAALAWDADAARARRDKASGARLPHFKIVGGYAHTLDARRLIPSDRDGDPGLFCRDMVSSELVVTMPLFTGGRLVNQIKAANLLGQAAFQHLARSREELVFNVSSVFNTILAQRHVIESLTFSRKTLTAHLNRIDALVKAQKAAIVDQMRTEVRLADIRQRLVRENNLLSIQHRTLANLLGVNDVEGKLSPNGALTMPENGLVPDLKSALSTAMESRGDYLAARADLEARAKEVDVARAGHWPVLSVRGAYGGRWAAGTVTGTGDEQGDAGGVGLVLEIPIFEGGRVSAAIREQRANLAAGRERYRLLALQVRLEVETALLNVASCRERADAICKAIARARESLGIEQLKYDLGKGAIVDVLDAQSALLESETTYYRVLADFHTGLAQLRLAMGEE